MPDADANTDSSKSDGRRRSAIGRKLATLQQRTRHRLARWILRKRSFWLYLLARTWVFPPVLWLTMQAPLRAPDSPRLSMAVKVAGCVLVAMLWFDATVRTERRWKDRRH